VSKEAHLNVPQELGIERNIGEVPCEVHHVASSLQQQWLAMASRMGPLAWPRAATHRPSQWLVFHIGNQPTEMMAVLRATPPQRDHGH